MKDALGIARYKYQAVPAPSQQDGHASYTAVPGPWANRQKSAVKLTLFGVLSSALIVYLAFAFVRAVAGPPCSPGKPLPPPCDTPASGFQCNDSISHFWGQYSPYFSVPSEIDASIPAECEVTFVQVLSRHGARNPTAGKTKKYNETVAQVHGQVTDYGSGYEFIRSYDYTLGADDLSVFGQQQMINSGIKFYERYRALASEHTPFVRSAGADRVVESAMNWTQGFHQTKLADHGPTGPDSYPYAVLAIPEADGTNNSLSHGLCTAFEDGPPGPDMADEAQQIWRDIFLPPIQARLNGGLPGANLSAAQTVYMMDMCPFDTVADTHGELSPFCGLFTRDEWRSYDYYESLGKWYGSGRGNPLGPTQGVGFTNELVARLTGTPVRDRTSTNATLDHDPATFPLDAVLYADFSHDNDMTAVFAAMGLYNATAQLSNTTREGAFETKGYAASWTVPFAARMYVEKMQCTGVPRGRGGEEEELVRVLVNDRVVPLPNCGADALGRCTLDRFVASLSFARDGGFWRACFP